MAAQSALGQNASLGNAGDGRVRAAPLVREIKKAAKTFDGVDVSDDVARAVREE
jgi:hypothetical protein